MKGGGPKNGKEFFAGKEGRVRETQEGFPAPFKSNVFRTFLKF